MPAEVQVVARAKEWEARIAVDFKPRAGKARRVVRSGWRRFPQACDGHPRRRPWSSSTTTAAATSATTTTTTARWRSAVERVRGARYTTLRQVAANDHYLITLAASNHPGAHSPANEPVARTNGADLAGGDAEHRQAADVQPTTSDQLQLHRGSTEEQHMRSDNLRPIAAHIDARPRPRAGLGELAAPSGATKMTGRALQGSGGRQIQGESGEAQASTKSKSRTRRQRVTESECAQLLLSNRAPSA